MQNPNEIANTQKFSDYFISALQQMSDSYKDLIQKATYDQEIAPTIQKIEEVFNTVIIDLEKILYNFCENTDIDLSTDTSKLNSIYIQEAPSETEEKRKVIQEIKTASLCIANPDTKEKLDRLVLTLEDIFNYVEQNPEEVARTNKFMEYYLPTSLKLVNAYKDLDQNAIQGENITSTKQEIEESLDIINRAFEKLLDSFYESLAMDISTDISVLNYDLTREGLTEDAMIDFKIEVED